MENIWKCSILAFYGSVNVGQILRLFAAVVGILVQAVSSHYSLYRVKECAFTAIWAQFHGSAYCTVLRFWLIKSLALQGAIHVQVSAKNSGIK